MYGREPTTPDENPPPGREPTMSGREPTSGTRTHRRDENPPCRNEHHHGDEARLTTCNTLYYTRLVRDMSLQAYHVCMETSALHRRVCDVEGDFKYVFWIYKSL
jgi:hypothetical protein